jgi:hypothetical protein
LCCYRTRPGPAGSCARSPVRCLAGWLAGELLVLPGEMGVEPAVQRKPGDADPGRGVDLRQGRVDCGALVRAVDAAEYP